LASFVAFDHIELDALYWGTNWTVREDFLERVTERAAGERWIADGNYEVARDRLWPRATAVVWLNYSFPLVFSRALRRTFGRIFSREQIFSGNRESLRTVLFDKEGIPWWVIRTHGKRRREFPEWFKRPEYRHLEIFELRHPRDAEAMFAGRAFA
jgi:adenylate kinase family enzyme